MLIEFACRAAMARNNVAFFCVGDMTERQMTMRFHIWLSKKSNMEKYCGDTLVPILDCVKNQENTCELKERECTQGLGIEEEDEIGKATFKRAPKSYCACVKCAKNNPSMFQGTYWYEERRKVKPLTWKEGLKEGRRFTDGLRAREFKLVSFPNTSINVKGIENQLGLWQQFENFVPDVIVIDYADILAPEDAKKEHRHQQNDTWKAMLALSQKWHCLVITATQADAAAFDAVSLKQKNFSEDKRKYGHVTGMLGLNQTEKEKIDGLMRINWLVLREGEFQVNSMCKIIQSLTIGRPILGSFF
jgi:hypothetical protein